MHVYNRAPLEPGSRRPTLVHEVGDKRERWGRTRDLRRDSSGPSRADASNPLYLSQIRGLDRSPTISAESRK